LKYLGTLIKLIAVAALLFPSIVARAENLNAILSKNDATTMFSLSRSAWENNVRQIKASGVGDFLITPSGEYTMSIRQNPDRGRLLVTPSYKPSNDITPWKLSVTVAADKEPVLSHYLNMSADIVKGVIQTSAREMAPEFSVMGYMARNPKTDMAPSLHFTIFRAGDFPPVDMMAKMGMVCPPQGGKQVCVRSSMIK
jgi:hypothetical protein